MQVSAELAAAIAALVALAIGFVVWRRNAGRASRAKPSSFRGPTSMYFTCAGCSAQFPHTKRTVAAWEKGSRRVFCNACHKRWRNAQPPQGQLSDPVWGAVQRNEETPLTLNRSTPTRAHETSGRGGCLSVVVLLLLVPAIVLVVIANA
ncbi:MAG: hypothetical protein IPJ21_20095 [Sterolibacteriaceae bacterium]|nr:hypothetical protein [Sterolibacteriaceae bacterium]